MIDCSTKWAIFFIYIKLQSEIDENLHKFTPQIEHGAFNYLPASAIRTASVKTTTIFNTLFTDYGRLLEDTRLRKTQKDKYLKKLKTYSLRKSIENVHRATWRLTHTARAYRLPTHSLLSTETFLLMLYKLYQTFFFSLTTNMFVTSDKHQLTMLVQCNV